MPKKVTVGLAILILGVLTSCSGRDDTSTNTPPKSTAMAWQEELPLTPGWLRDHLPENALAYQRLPNPFALFSAPKGSVLDAALGSEAHVRNVIAIRESLASNVLDKFDELNDPRLRLVVQHLRSPVEMAVLGPDDESVALAVLTAFNLDLSTHEEFEKLITEMVQDLPGAALEDGLDDDGFGALAGLPFAIVMHFDAASGRVLLMAGPAVSTDLLRARMAGLSAGGAHAMYAMQEDIDESGQGYFLWADPKNLMKLGQMFMPPDVWRQMHDSGLDQVDSMALGWGVANGKGRLRIAAVLPDVEARQFVPVVKNSPAIKSVGVPDAFFLLSVPTETYFARIEALLLPKAEPEEQQKWAEFKQSLQDELGLTLQELLGALGPEIIYIADDVGDYIAVRVRNDELWRKFTAAVSAKIERDIKTHQRRNGEIKHWSIPSMYSFADLPDDQEIGPLALLMGMDEHVYWTREGDFLFLSQIPQPLMDRMDRGANTDVGAWLRDSQRQDVAESVLAISARTNKLPRRLYYVYLELLQGLASLTKADYDPWSLPTAAQLDLPRTGAVGFSVNLGDPVLSMELLFENNPMEGMFSGSMTTVAVVGILAAIAIPAYQDYTLRAEVAGGLTAVARHKTMLAEFYGQNNRYPNADELTQLMPDDPIFGEFAIAVEPDTGTIVVSFDNEQLGEDAQLYFEADADQGHVEFLCTTNMSLKFVPKSCRDEY